MTHSLNPKADANASAFSLTAQDRLIVALDLPNAAAALAMATQLKDTVRWVKVGLELYLAAGQSVVTDLRNMGFEVFLDLKLHDIPNTVAGAVRSVSRSGASLLTLHSSGGPVMLRAAVEAAGSVEEAPRLLGVTVLTSMDAVQLAATGVPDSPADQVVRLGTMAMASGVDGLVCSPRETSLLQAALDQPLLVVPGIRPSGSAKDDQSRAETPADAIQSGATMLVVGRPITQAASPAEAAAAILAEIETA